MNRTRWNASRTRSRRRRAGFSLLEVLIAAAILAVLASIASVEYLHAQVRSRLARAQSDLRAIATALEAYRSDQTAYPETITYCASRMDAIDDYNQLPDALTTPVAYLAARPEDPFNRGRAYKYLAPGPGWANGYPTILAIWVPASFPEDEGPASDVPYFSQRASPVAWAVWSVGPRGALSVFESDMRRIPVPRRTWYDPTNGTISEGIVTRLSTGHRAPDR